MGNISRDDLFAAVRDAALATYGERLQIHTSVQEWREKVFVHKHLVKRDDLLLCEGLETRALCVRLPGQDQIKAIAIPPDIKAKCL